MELDFLQLFFQSFFNIPIFLLISFSFFIIRLIFLHYFYPPTFILFATKARRPKKIQVGMIGTNKACAACKYQRRRCSKDCPLAPYFPSDKPKTFSNAHRLFGVSNIMRILKQVQPDEREEAMKSIIFESDMRAKYPIDGCYGVIKHYRWKEYHAMEELHYVQRLLSLYKEQSQIMPLIPMDQSSLFKPTSSAQFPINNHGEVSSLINDGNLLYACDANNYIESKDMDTCRSGITNVSSSALDANCNLMLMDGLSYHENHLDNIPAGTTNINADTMDAKSAKFNTVAKQGVPYHKKRDVSEFDDDRRSFVDQCKVACESRSSVGLLGIERMDIDSCRSGITNVTSALDANANLMLMDGLSYHENQLDNIAAGTTNINADTMDVKPAKFNMMDDVQGLPYHKKRDISEYDDDKPFDGFEDHRSFVDQCKVACESWSSVGLLGIESKDIDSCRSGISNVGTSALDANYNLMLMDGLSYHENQLDNIADGYTHINADTMDVKPAMFNMMADEQGLPHHKKRDVCEYDDDTPFDGFDDHRRSFVDQCKVAFESRSSVGLLVA